MHGSKHTTVASIPSKYEITLIENARERDGFGIRSHRFSTSETDVPGPGTYKAELEYLSPLVVDCKRNGSISCKGYSGLASRTDRFGFLERKEEEQRSRPGPGSYSSAYIKQTLEKGNIPGPVLSFTIEMATLS